MNLSRKFLWCVAAVVAVASCRSQYDALLSSNDVDAKYAAAFDYFNQGKYQKAASLFESMSVLTEGTSKDDTVQYYWGLSNYKFKDYITAEANFSKFVSTYPRSPFAEDARFLRLDCLYKSTYRYELDQAPTRVAISAIYEYEKDYGKDNPHLDECIAMLTDLKERLDRKAYEPARLYYKMEDYKASRVAFRNILKENSENVYREDILYYVAMSSYKYAQMSVPSKEKFKIHSDYGRLREIIENFMSNALKFTDRGSISITFEQLENGHVRHQRKTEPDRLQRGDELEDLSAGI